MKNKQTTIKSIDIIKNTNNRETKYNPDTRQIENLILEVTYTDSKGDEQTELLSEKIYVDGSFDMENYFTGELTTREVEKYLDENGKVEDELISLGIAMLRTQKD